jgi:hypothetical protein
MYMQLSLTRITHNTNFMNSHLAAYAYSITLSYYSQYEFYEFTPCCICIQLYSRVQSTIRNFDIYRFAAYAYSFYSRVLSTIRNYGIYLFAAYAYSFYSRVLSTIRNYGIYLFAAYAYSFHSMF